jgi:hypothetical protein
MHSSARSVHAHVAPCPRLPPLLFIRLPGHALFFHATTLSSRPHSHFHAPFTASSSPLARISVSPGRRLVRKSHTLIRPLFTHSPFLVCVLIHASPSLVCIRPRQICLLVSIPWL